MMRILILALAVLGSVAAFQVGISRRTAIVEGGGAAILTGIMIGSPQVSKAFSQQLDDKAPPEPAQQATSGKIDLNSAFVGDYKVLRGMFPHAAGKIASNGPYKSVKDIYNIQGLTDRDKKLFRQYEREFTTNPPGRAFKERINGRVST